METNSKVKKKSKRQDDRYPQICRMSHSPVQTVLKGKEQIMQIIKLLSLTKGQ